MIKSLHVKNFALIDDLEMDFLDGLSAMTGETGAGKSIILESMQLLFGKRSDAQMIRHGQSKAYVSGLFSISKDLQNKFALDQEIKVEREIDLNGRHQMKINSEIITLSRLKEVMNQMGSIHSQNETMNLFERTYYLEFIDQVDSDKINQLLNKYLLDRSHYLGKKKYFEDLKNKKNQSLQKQDFYEYQVKELKQLNLVSGEKEELEEKIEKLKNFDKITSSLKLTYQLLDQEDFNIDKVYEASKSLSKIEDLDQDYKDISKRLVDAYYDLDDVKSKLFDLINSMDFDEDEFNLMQERTYELQKIELKYDKKIDELIDYLKEIEDELLLITDYDQFLILARNELESSYKMAYQSGLKLSELRKKLAKKLASDVLLELKDLDLEKASFEIVFDEILEHADLLETGLDQVEFMISLNEGEPIKPLSKVASGGERARFMFSLKSIYAKSNALSLLILDEIDIGISGKTAAKVANKMKELSKMMQLIVITHLPQVAAKADHHYQIVKIKENNRMVTRIKDLNHDQRVEEIAMMLSDEKLSHFAIEQAKMLLNK
jgi:DNA repair protein RecN (Recombination protein N)